MRIKRFNENVQEISQERTEELIGEIDDFLSILNDKDKYLDSLINELKTYQDLNSKSNDQIDDSIEQLEIAKKDLANSYNKLNVVLENFNSYKDENRKSMYNQTKDF